MTHDHDITSAAPVGNCDACGSVVRVAQSTTGEPVLLDVGEQRFVAVGLAVLNPITGVAKVLDADDTATAPGWIDAGGKLLRLHAGSCPRRRRSA